jgi:hypothetical protein
MRIQHLMKACLSNQGSLCSWVIMMVWFICVGDHRFAIAQNNPAANAGQNPAAGGFAGGGFGAAGGFSANANMIAEFRGKLKGFQRGIVYVQKEDGTEAMVQLPESISNFQFVAIAKPAFLQRGQLVRLSGAFNPTNGMAVTPINKVELFQPVTGGLSGRTREQFIPGIYPEQRGENPQAFAEPVQCRVVGAVMGLNANGVLMVQAGGRPLQIQLAPEATFEIRYNNLSLAQEGDEISVTGFYQPPDENRIRAERITVTTDRVYGEFSDEPPKRATRRRATREPVDDEKEMNEGEARADVNGDGKVNVEGKKVNANPEAAAAAEAVE